MPSRASSAPHSAAAAAYSGRVPDRDPQKTQIRLISRFKGLHETASPAGWQRESARGDQAHRLANSTALGQIAFANGGQTRMTTTKQYDYLNRLTSISSAPSAAAVVSFAYQYNSANQRTAVTGNDGSYWTYAYDPLGQVTNGFKSWADTTLVAGEQFQYGFDTIGNRTRTAAGGDSSGAGLRTANYHANLLNQYTNRDVPATFDVLGLALATNTTVAVNGQTPYRKSEFFRQQLSVTNTSSAVWQSVSVTATNAGTTTGNVFIAQTPEHFTYDLDGNLTSDGHWSYTWDAENRLIGMTNIASTAPAQGLVFGYDWKWRRVQKQVWYNGSLTNNAVFAYDGWNLTARLNATNSGLAQSYLWGLDLSGSPQGAGGVGGLLELNDAANGSHFAAFDGNGNVAALVAAGGGTNSAAYEYGPFGETLRTTGPMAKVNPVQFATAFQENETPLLYYGDRYGNPEVGTRLGRVRGAASPNDYSTLQNDPVSRPPVLTKPPQEMPRLGGQTATYASPGPCGEIGWGIYWNISGHVPTSGGVVVQQLTISFEVFDCATKVQKPASGSGNTSSPLTYWEAWPVLNSGLVPSNGVQLGSDVFQFPSQGVGTYGHFSFVGYATYYNTPLSNVISQGAWMTNNPSTWAHELYSTTTPPTNLGSGSNTLIHQLKGAWNCCNGCESLTKREPPLLGPSAAPPPASAGATPSR